MYVLQKEQRFVARDTIQNNNYLGISSSRAARSWLISGVVHSKQIIEENRTFQLIVTQFYYKAFLTLEQEFCFVQLTSKKSLNHRPNLLNKLKDTMFVRVTQTEIGSGILQ